MTSSFDLTTHGAALYGGAACAMLPALDRFVATLPADRAGLRLHGRPLLADLLGPGHAPGRIAAAVLGLPARPVRAILFDKTAATNWALGWHQDRTIAVRARVGTPGFGPWTVKAGIQHVEPPFAIIAAMLTVRIHLDDVPDDNAPLLIAPGSHTLGRIAEGAIADTVARCGTVACTARAGDIWAYATPILHASAAASGAGHRRVLQVDFSASGLPGDLAWLGV
ncbi:phytanoyl-CoA dioxygenase [Sphingomonas sp. Leaf17]|nr:phytanoyl-CoA dioxygenase [Sphingomonas sp. Leaf17]